MDACLLFQGRFTLDREEILQKIREYEELTNEPMADVSQMSIKEMIFYLVELEDNAAKGYER